MRRARACIAPVHWCTRSRGGGNCCIVSALSLFFPQPRGALIRSNNNAESESIYTCSAANSSSGFTLHHERACKSLAHGPSAPPSPSGAEFGCRKPVQLKIEPKNFRFLLYARALREPGKPRSRQPVMAALSAETHGQRFVNINFSSAHAPDLGLLLAD